MDCVEAKEKIDLYVDEMLDDGEKQRLVRHAASCPQCKKAIDDAMRLKKALAGLKEAEPPAGLAASAVRKARRRRIPIYAYASAAAAAVIALLLIFSPPLLPQTQTRSADGNLMASAAEADTGAEYSMAAGCAGSEKAESQQEAQDGLVAEMPAPGTESSGEAFTACTDTCVYDSETAFCEAIRSSAEGVRGLTQYYRPAYLPEGASLLQIEASGYSIRWVYSYGADRSETLVFEWLRTRTEDELQGWGEKTLLLSDNLAHSFAHSGGAFWSAEALFNEDGELEATDGSAINAYWAQDGAAFHAQLPAGFTEAQILACCAAEAVPVG